MFFSRLLQFSFILLYSFCIERNNANYSSIGLLANSNLVNTNAVVGSNMDWNGCMMNYKNTYSFCFEIPKSACKPSFLINIATNEILQNRKDDLAFLGINYSNCSAFSPSLSLLYQKLIPPASTFLERISGLTGPYAESDFTISFRESCSYPSISVPQNINFQRFLTELEFYSQDRLEMELGWMAGTTQTCLQDLNQSSQDIETTFGIRANQIIPGSACAFSTDPNLATCPW